MNLLNQRCKIERAVLTKNAQKQTVKTWKTIGSSVPCNIQFNTISRNRLNKTASGFTTEGEYLGFFDKNQSLLKGDKITWGNIIFFVDGIPFPVYASINSVHHIEATLSVEET